MSKPKFNSSSKVKLPTDAEVIFNTPGSATLGKLETSILWQVICIFLLRVNFSLKVWDTSKRGVYIWITAVILSDWLAQTIASLVLGKLVLWTMALSLLSYVFILLPARFVKVLSILLVIKAMLSLIPFIATELYPGQLGPRWIWEAISFTLTVWTSAAMFMLLLKYFRTPRSTFEV